jgi:hypothetical protein
MKIVCHLSITEYHELREAHKVVSVPSKKDGINDVFVAVDKNGMVLNVETCGDGTYTLLPIAIDGDPT